MAAGIAMCVKALAEATAIPPASPIIVEYRGRRMAFGRKNLAKMDGYVRLIFESFHILQPFTRGFLFRMRSE
jgi:hypothetical protein